jgi:hypothetical protein
LNGTMAPPKQPPKTVKEAVKQKNSLMTGFFNKKKSNKLGRPKKKRNSANDSIEVERQPKKKKRGPISRPKLPLSTASKPDVAPTVSATKKLADGPKPKLSRANWNRPDTIAKLEKAVSDWDTASGDALDDNDEKLSLQAFALRSNHTLLS